MQGMEEKLQGYMHLGLHHTVSEFRFLLAMLYPCVDSQSQSVNVLLPGRDGYLRRQTTQVHPMKLSSRIEFALPVHHDMLPER